MDRSNTRPPASSDVARSAIDFGSLPQWFPIKQRRCYLNNASIGPMSLPVIEAVTSFMADVRDNGRNNYPHWCALADTDIKDRIASLIGAHRSEIAFVKNTTEGLITVANGFPWREGDNVIIADIEYPSNVYCWMKLQARGVELRWVRTHWIASGSRTSRPSWTAGRGSCR